jgi:Cytochrome b5-like Heme/Steroid binding domain
LEDRAEGLWRIHDDLYDLTDFIADHPGGESWIRFTKGTDITEAFEIHHLTALPFQLLKKYKVREAAQPRLYRFTFNEDGFYKTLRRKVLDRMKTIDKSKSSASKMILDSLLALTFGLAIASAALNWKSLAAAAGLTMTFAMITAHNFFHQRDNWRMKVFNLGFLTYT